MALLITSGAGDKSHQRPGVCQDSGLAREIILDDILRELDQRARRAAAKLNTLENTSSEQ